jgi:hypothetical protein
VGEITDHGHIFLCLSKFKRKCEPISNVLFGDCLTTHIHNVHKMTEEIGGTGEGGVIVGLWYCHRGTFVLTTTMIVPCGDIKNRSNG